MTRFLSHVDVETVAETLERRHLCVNVVKCIGESKRDRRGCPSQVTCAGND